MSKNGGVPVPPMPPALVALVSETIGNVPTTSQDVRARTSPPEPPQPIPTVHLLERIDALYAAYIRLVDVTHHSLQAEASVPGARNHAAEQQQQQQQQQEDRQESLKRAIAAATADVEKCTADIQEGIRSKVQQTARMAIINHLRAEVTRRRAAVEKMESTLSITQKYL